jgi:hypothetical protein
MRKATIKANGSVTTEASSPEATSWTLRANQEGAMAETKLLVWPCQRALAMLIFFTNEYHT